jgi:hypothetical protein
MTPLITKAVTFFPEIAADYKWFDIADVDHGVMYTHKENMELIRSPLPFEKCAIAGIDMDGQTYAVLVSQEEDKWLVQGANTLATFDNLRVQIDPVFSINPMEENTNDGITIFYKDERVYDNQSDAAKQVINISIIVIGTFLKNLYEQKINTVYTPIPSKNHAKRIRQGKKPMFDWHTVMIEPPKQKLPDQGGTHSSPRLHDVRGHWVNRSGKRFWRKPHQRGDASLGIVFHDYKIKEGA